MTAWIKMTFAMELGLGPGDFVFDGDQACPEKDTAPTQFWPMSIVAKQLAQATLC